VDENEKAALSTVNRIRRELGLPPRDKLKKGYRGSASYCPISRSIKADAAKHGVRKLDITTSGSFIMQHDKHGYDLKAWQTNVRTQRFCLAFDRDGQYPHLVLPGATPNPAGL
jgi:hypothetical protein